MALRVALLGPPGAGKGTQAQLLAGGMGIDHIATGDILRDAVARGTESGKVARGFMERGELVPDELIVAIVRDELRRLDQGGKGFVLDGFPRTEAQARALDDMLDGMGVGLHAVIYIDVPEEELVKRLSGRRVCESCGASFHLQFSPPPSTGECPNCGGKLRQRSDDAEETVIRRLRVYREQTAPLIQHYSEKGVLRRVDGRGTIEEVRSAIRAALEEALGSRFGEPRGAAPRGTDSVGNAGTA